MLITDINTAGASDIEFRATSGDWQLTVAGTWNGGSVALQKYIAEATTWATVYTLTADAQITIEALGSAVYRTSTTHGGSVPVLIAEAIGVAAI